MNKGDLVDKISEDINITKIQANAVIDSLIGIVSKSLRAGEPVKLVGFGTFLITKRKARKARNPKTNEIIMAKAKKTVRFRAGREFLGKL
jgi:DNA-binding protein HU-beta